jgi:hypothetical protein
MLFSLSRLMPDGHANLLRDQSGRPNPEHQRVAWIGALTVCRCHRYLGEPADSGFAISNTCRDWISSSSW